MFSYASGVDVARQPEEAFAAVIDIARWGEWTDMRDIRHDGSGPIGVGTTGSFRMAGPFSGPIRYELTSMDEGRRVEYRVTHPAFEWRAEMTVEPRAGGSRLGTRGDFRLHGWRRLLEPIVAREVRRGEATELERLKALLEAAPASTVAMEA